MEWMFGWMMYNPVFFVAGCMIWFFVAYIALSPFVWLGVKTWEHFAKCNRSKVREYEARIKALEDRVATLTASNVVHIYRPKQMDASAEKAWRAISGKRA